jgi:two-component system, LytTR family, sensor kinase
MKPYQKHIFSWFLYIFYTFIVSLILLPDADYVDFLFSHSICICFFYAFYNVIELFNKRKFFKSIFLFLVVLLTFGLIRYIIIYYILFPIGHASFYQAFEWSSFLLECIAFITQYSIYSIGYWFANSALIKERKLRYVEYQQHVMERGQLKLEEQNLILNQNNQQLLFDKQLLEKKQLQTEAAFLRSQINPHFLQNTLNFLYGKTRKHASELSEGVLLLSEIMHYSLEATKNTEDVTTLKDEVRHLQNLINLQQLRFSNQLYIELATTGNWEQVKLPPLTLITLAENAFKYGEMHDAKTPVTICLHVTEQEQQLHYKVTNKKKTGPVEVSYGIGHENIRNRLSMRYQNRFELQTKDEDDIYTVNLTINLTP